MSLLGRKLVIFRHFVWRWSTHPVPYLAGTAAAWTALIVLAPIAPVLVAAVAYGLGGVVCHQMAERSFHLAGAQLAVCARCTGIYAGASLSLLLQCARWRADMPTVGWLFRDTASGFRFVLMLGLFPTLITVAAEQTGLWYPSNGVRAVAGMPLGMAVAFVTGRAATLHLLDRWRQRRLA